MLFFKKVDINEGKKHFLNPKQINESGIFGVCNRFGENGEGGLEEGNKGAEIRFKSPFRTMVQWPNRSDKIVAKFKVGLEDICKHLSKIMELVGGDLKGMLFKQ